MMKYKVFYCLLFFCLFSFSCSNNKAVNQKDSDNSGSDVAEKKEAFSVFVEKIHNDSIFALSRIEGEIPGTNTDDYTIDSIDIIGGTEYLGNTERIWTKEELKDELHEFNLLREDKEKYSTKFVKTDDCVEEILYIQDAGFSLHIVFQLRGDKWFVKQYDVINL